MDDKNKQLKPIFDFFKNVRQEGTLRKYFNFPVRGVLPKEEDRNKFYRYYGSLTTPGCNEVVVWTVFKEKLEISSDQIKQLRKLQHGLPEEPKTRISNNFRDVQPLNERELWYVKIEDSDDDDDDDDDHDD